MPDPTITPLSLFLSRQLELRGFTPDEFARVSGLVRSHVYFILDGKRVNVRSDTIDKIAAALGMTPAEMLVAMGKGTSDLAPDELEHLAAYRRLPSAKKPTATEIICALGVQPIRRGHHVEHDVTDDPDAFDRSNRSSQLPNRPIPSVRRRYESQSVASQIARFGFEPATV